MLLTIALWLVAFWAAWGYRQADQALRGLETQVSDVRRVLFRLEQSGDIDDLRRQLAGVQQELASDRVPFPVGDVSLSLAELIVQAEASSGLDLIEASEAPRIEVIIGEGKYQSVRYRIKMAGTIVQFQDFLGRIEGVRHDESGAFYRLRNVSVEELKMAGAAGQSWSYNFDLVVHTQL